MKNAVRLISLLLLAQACNGVQFAPEFQDIEESGNVGHDMIVLGKQLDDPYSVNNMTKALASVYGTKADRVVVRTTDYYVRFLPSGEDQYNELVKSGIKLIDHPLDYEIIREGDWYHDPGIPEGEFTWQYAVVDKNFIFPDGIRYEKLEDCYISENDTATKSDEWIDWAAVEAESYRLTGNGKMLSQLTKAGGNTPSGRITIEDDRIEGPIGVKGVLVSCNSFVKFASAVTEEDGSYSMDKSFSAAEIRYRLEFKNKYGFGIGFNLVLVPASLSTLGKASSGGIDYHIDKTSERKLFCRCVVNNAGYDYYKDCGERGMQTPPENLRIWLFQNMEHGCAPMLQQGAVVDGPLFSKYLGQYVSLVKMFLPDITLGLKDDMDYASIYGDAIHEMAHASHFVKAEKTFWNQYIRSMLTSALTSGSGLYGTGTEEDKGYCEVSEMWAYYVQTMFHRERYKDETAVFGTTYWFRPQILVTLDERGLVRQKTINALTSDICDRDGLQKKLVSLYPEMKNTINQVFGRYD